MRTSVFAGRRGASGAKGCVLTASPMQRVRFMVTTSSRGNTWFIDDGRMVCGMSAEPSAKQVRSALVTLNRHAFDRPERQGH